VIPGGFVPTFGNDTTRQREVRRRLEGDRGRVDLPEPSARAIVGWPSTARLITTTTELTSRIPRSSPLRASSSSGACGSAGSIQKLRPSTTTQEPSVSSILSCRAASARVFRTQRPDVARRRSRVRVPSEATPDLEIVSILGLMHSIVDLTCTRVGAWLPGRGPTAPAVFHASAACNH